MVSDMETGVLLVAAAPAAEKGDADRQGGEAAGTPGARSGNSWATSWALPGARRDARQESQ